MSRSYAFNTPPAELAASLAKRLGASGDELIVDPHQVREVGQHPVAARALARALRRRRWPGHRVSSFVSAVSRPWEQRHHMAAGLRRVRNRAARHHSKAVLQQQALEEIE